jgi:hypothetical protein
MRRDGRELILKFLSASVQIARGERDLRLPVDIQLFMSSILRSRVLCLSRDPNLLRTRQMILASRYDAMAAGSVEQLAEVAPGQEFDVILLCHTFSSEECRVIEQIARGRWPHAKIMAIAGERPDCSNYADFTVRGLDGPGKLLGALEHLTSA